jgi:glycosyltransferase involved in cell wall biosynthesis
MKNTMKDNLHAHSPVQLPGAENTSHYMPDCDSIKHREVTIGYVSYSNPFKDKKNWSGTTYKIREAIELSGCKVIWIPYKKNSFPILIIKVLLKIYSKLTRSNIISDHIKIIGKLQSFTIDETKYAKCNYLFFSGQSLLLFNIKTKKPIIYYSDATFHLMVDYYWHNLVSWNIRQGDDIERTSLHKSKVVIHSSKWAGESAVNFYGVPEKKCHVLELGANLEDGDIINVEPYDVNNVLKILFSGVDWKRKGAEIAIETVDYLNKNNIKAKLILTGINIDSIPENFRDIPFVEYVGFLNKNVPEQYNKYITTIMKCHLFLLPTKAECAGIVFSEASAYGLPIFTYDTGGIANYVVNGYNGYRLSLPEKGDAFARKIMECIEQGELQKLRGGCLQLYKEKLSWKSWASRFKEVIENEEKSH